MPEYITVVPEHHVEVGHQFWRSYTGALYFAPNDRVRTPYIVVFGRGDRLCPRRRH